MRTSGTQVMHRSGSEGSRHDPYGWEMWTISRRGLTAEFFVGSLYNSYLRVYDQETDELLVEIREQDNMQHNAGDYNQAFNRLERAFEEIMGFSVDAFEKAHWQAEGRMLDAAEAYYDNPRRYE